MDDILGYDCDVNAIFEYSILRGIWTNDISIEDLPDTDPRSYCALYGSDGNAYAVSVFDYIFKGLIRARENLSPNEDISVIVKPISEMQYHEISYNRSLDEVLINRNKLKKELEKYLKKSKVKTKKK